MSRCFVRQRSRYNFLSILNYVTSAFQLVEMQLAAEIRNVNTSFLLNGRWVVLNVADTGSDWKGRANDLLFLRWGEEVGETKAPLLCQFFHFDGKWKGLPCLFKHILSVPVLIHAVWMEKESLVPMLWTSILLKQNGFRSKYTCKHE